VVCNAAEGEPGTFKDRWLMRSNPYQLLEGIAIACAATGAAAAFIGTKERFVDEVAALERAAGEMEAAGLLGDVTISIVPGPDDYLFGEEKALLEVIEGRDPLPRLYPPYVEGLFGDQRGESYSVVVNNVETLSNVPHVAAYGPGAYRSLGTEASPGTMVFTIGGDVERETVVEMELGTPFSRLLAEAGGARGGGDIVMVANGVSNRPLTPAELDLPMDFDSMKAAGTGLGSGGFTVYDSSACVAQVAAALSAFLYDGSCGQCPPCKLGTEEISRGFGALASGGPGMSELEDVAAWAIRVTDSNRCGLGAAQRALADGVLTAFPEHLAAHVAGSSCPTDRVVEAPVIVDWDREAGRFTYKR
jgi:NADH:ubiquinone oxidoreductase subunit F (NADH-binding)